MEAKAEELREFLRESLKGNLSSAYLHVNRWTPEEREYLAQRLSDGAVFLRRVNKDWYGAMNFPAENEE